MRGMAVVGVAARGVYWVGVPTGGGAQLRRCGEGCGCDGVAARGVDWTGVAARVRS